MADIRYDPWGKTRYSGNGGYTPTDRRYTGQLWDGAESAGGTGLYFYNARYYDPLLARFTQADTLVPDPASPQSFNRYAYTLNNPLKYTDPTGHCAEHQLSGDGLYEQCTKARSAIEDEFGVIFLNGEQWNLTALRALQEGFVAFRNKISHEVYRNLFLNYGTRISIELIPGAYQGEWISDGNKMELGMALLDNRKEMRFAVVHELAHALIDRLHGSGLNSGNPTSWSYAAATGWEPTSKTVKTGCMFFIINCKTVETTVWVPPASASPYSRTVHPFPEEDFADTFAALTVGGDFTVNRERRIWFADFILDLRGNRRHRGR